MHDCNVPLLQDEAAKRTTVFRVASGTDKRLRLQLLLSSSIVQFQET